MSSFLHAPPNQIEQQVQLHPPTTWAARHAAWTLNRYQVGRLTEFAEPVYAKWYKSLFLGKSDGQDSFFVFNGNSILPTRSSLSGILLTVSIQFRCQSCSRKAAACCHKGWGQPTSTFSLSWQETRKQRQSCKKALKEERERGKRGRKNEQGGCSAAEVRD